MKVDGSLGSLLQGVSKQPPRDRLPGQCTDQLNMSSDPITGLTRRPPTDFIGSLAEGSSRRWYNFKTVSGRRFIIGVIDNQIRVWDVHGVEYDVVKEPEAAAYVAANGELSFATTEDQVIIANAGVVCEMIPGNKEFVNAGVGSSPMGLIHVIGGQYAREYRVTKDGATIAMYKTPNGSSPNHASFVRTSLIASRLFQSMTVEGPDIVGADGGGDSSLLIQTGALASGYTVTRVDDVIWIVADDPDNTFSLSCSDDMGNVNMKVCTNTVPSISDVPRLAPEGYVLRVATEPDPEEDLFLEFKTDSVVRDGYIRQPDTGYKYRTGNFNTIWRQVGGVIDIFWDSVLIDTIDFGADHAAASAYTTHVTATWTYERGRRRSSSPVRYALYRHMYDANLVTSGFGTQGYWQETISPDVDHRVNTQTLPVVLEWFDASESFTLSLGQWKDRRVGTDVSNPLPSFIGQTINDMATFQSRLVFLAGSFVCMSRTNKYSDFWMGSAANLVDSDPIDVSSTAVEASVMRRVTNHNRDLLVFSESGQFSIQGRTALTPANAALSLTTAFEANLDVAPVISGPYAYFATRFGRYTNIREMYTDGVSAINDARPITQHVRNLIQGSASILAASSNFDMLAVGTDLDNKLLYIYQYIWAEQDKVQSSWSRWEFFDSVEYMFFEEENMFIVHRYDNSNKFYLAVLSLDVLEEPGLDFAVHLDNRCRADNVNTVCYVDTLRMDFDNAVAVQGEGCPNPGMAVPIVSYAPSGTGMEITLKYDMQGGSVVIGTPYVSMYRPTMPLPKDSENSVMSTAKLRVKAFSVALEKTGYITGRLVSRYGDGEPVHFQGRVVGDPGNTIGNPALSDETFVVPFREQTDKADIILYTDRYTPMTILDIEWTGQSVKRGRRWASGGGSREA